MASSDQDRENTWNPEPVDLDELEGEDINAGIASDTEDEYIRDEYWETEYSHIPDIHLRRLDEVVNLGYPGDPHDKSRTGGIVCPKALDLAWRAIKRGRQNWTKARIQRVTVYHGVRIAYYDDDIRAIIKTYNKLLKISQTMDDDDLINTLAERKPFSFRDPHPKPTSMGTLKFLEGAIADLADCLGIAKSNMYSILSLLSVITHEPAMWPTSLSKEYRTFRDVVGERLAKLEKEYKRVGPEQNKQ
jgi:hypothetical protein